MRSKFCFIHIEKAGGSTIHNWLKYYLPNYLSLAPFFIWTNDQKSEFSKKEFSLLKTFHPFVSGVGGHRLRSFLDYESLFGEDFKYITFLRSPVSRYLSHFQHQNDVMFNRRSLDEFLQEKRFNNFMCVKICGKEDGQLAFNHLKEKFSFIGFVEQFNKSLFILTKILKNKNLLPYYEKRNEGNSENKLSFQTLSKEHQKLILDRNKEDIILYDLAFKYFANYYDNDYVKPYQSELQTLENNIGQFRYNRLRKHLIRIYKGYNHYFLEPFVRIMIRK